MNDTTRRFLDAVLERVPESRIVEVRLFPAIRQGGVESGIAVLAVHPEPSLALPGTSVLDADDVSDSLFDEATEVGGRRGETPVGLRAFDDDTTDSEPSPEDFSSPGEGPAGREEREISASPTAPDEELPEREIMIEGIAPVPTPGDPAAADEDGPAEEIAVDRGATFSDTDRAEADDTIALGDLFALPARSTPQAGHDRLAILCARYKLIVKGPDRGRWDLEIVHQADAPLDTLDSVIKGVVRRSGDDAVPERFSRQSLRDLLDAPAWATDA